MFEFTEWYLAYFHVILFFRQSKNWNDFLSYFDSYWDVWGRHGRMNRKVLDTFWSGDDYILNIILVFILYFLGSPRIGMTFPLTVAHHVSSVMKGIWRNGWRGCWVLLVLTIYPSSASLTLVTLPTGKAWWVLFHNYTDELGCTSFRIKFLLRLLYSWSRTEFVDVTLFQGLAKIHYLPTVSCLSIALMIRYSLVTLSFGWSVKPRPRVNRLSGACSLN